MSLHQTVSPTSLLSSSLTSGGSSGGSGGSSGTGTLSNNPRHSVTGPPLLPVWAPADPKKTKEEEEDANNTRNNYDDDDDTNHTRNDTNDTDNDWKSLSSCSDKEASEGTITFEPEETSGSATTHSTTIRSPSKAVAFAPLATTHAADPLPESQRSTLHHTTTTNGNNHTNGNNGNSGGFYLRWSRLHKVVEVKSESNSGLLRSNSISASFHAGKHHHQQQQQQQLAAPSVFNHKSKKKNTTTTTTTTTTKIILNQVSGSAAPGELLACMGPSGSGKTSLMNVLSGRSSYQEGTISINGEPLQSHHSMKRLMAKVAYVKQSDIFFGHLTVRDQFTYTALLRLTLLLCVDAPRHQHHY